MASPPAVRLSYNNGRPIVAAVGPVTCAVRAELEDNQDGDDDRMWVVIVETFEEDYRIQIRGNFQGCRGRIEPLLRELCLKMYQGKAEGWQAIPQRFVDDLGRPDDLILPLLRVRRYLRPFGPLPPINRAKHYSMDDPAMFAVVLVMMGERMYCGNDALVWKTAYELLGTFLDPSTATTTLTTITAKRWSLLKKAMIRYPSRRDGEDLANFRPIYNRLAVVGKRVSNLIKDDRKRTLSMKQWPERFISFEPARCTQSPSSSIYPPPSALWCRFLEAQVANFSSSSTTPDLCTIFPTCDAWALQQTLNICFRKLPDIFPTEHKENEKRYLVVPAFPRGCHLFYKNPRDMDLLRYALFYLDHRFEYRSKKRKIVRSAWPVVLKQLTQRADDSDFVQLSLRIIARWTFAPVPKPLDWDLATKCMQVLLTRLDDVLTDNEDTAARWWISLATGGPKHRIPKLFRSVLLASHKHYISGTGAKILHRLLEGPISNPAKHPELAAFLSKREDWLWSTMAHIPPEMTLALYRFVCDRDVVEADSDLGAILWDMDVIEASITAPPKLPRRSCIEPCDETHGEYVRGLGLALALSERISFSKPEIYRMAPSQLRTGATTTNGDDPFVSDHLTYETSLLVCPRYFDKNLPVVSFDGTESPLLMDILTMYSNDLSVICKDFKMQGIGTTITTTTTTTTEKKEKRKRKTPTKKKKKKEDTSKRPRLDQ